jgi:hypothetical protein
LGFEGYAGAGLECVNREIGIERVERRRTFVCVILCKRMRIDIRWEKSPAIWLACHISEFWIPELQHTQDPKKIHDE